MATTIAASARLNRISDVPGLRVGNAVDATICSGVTVLMADRPMVAAVDVRGGGPGTRETDALSLTGTIDEVHAIVLAGGSAFGLAAASGVQGWLAAHGIGLDVRGACVPIVPQAILFDLLNGGVKRDLPSAYMRLGEQACGASAREFTLGSAGAGYGATTANLRGGLGSASSHLPGGVIVGALVAVNAVGSVTIGDTGRFWAAPLEHAGEFGGLGLPTPWPAEAHGVPLKGSAQENTTIAIVATNVRLDKRGAHRLAVMAQTGLPRAIHPVHTPLDGDVVFAVSCGDVALADQITGLARLGAAASDTLARAIARAVYEAAPAPPGWHGPPAWRERFKRA